MFALLGCVQAGLRLDDPAPAGGESVVPTPLPEPIETLPGDSAEVPDGEDVEGDLYAPDTILRLELEIGDEAWQALRRDGSEYADATLRWEGEALLVAVHVKGSSSWQDISDKPSLVVDVNRRVDQRFLGVTKFYLHNDCYDPSMMSETLSYGFYREWGYPASRTSFARLEVNGEDYGFYTVVEPHEDGFLETWFADPDGNLYENAEAYCDVDELRCMEVEQEDEGDHAAFERLAELLEPREDWWTVAQEQLDGEAFIAYLALELSLVHWDSYSYDLSNFRLYHEPTADRWTMLTQSMDLDYGYRPWSYPNCGQYAMDPDDWTMGGLAERCHRDEACFAALLDAVEDYADRLEAADGAARVQALDAWIAEEVKSDPRRYSDDRDYDDHVACLQDFFAARPDQLREWVAGRR